LAQAAVASELARRHGLPSAEEVLEPQLVLINQASGLTTASSGAGQQQQQQNGPQRQHAQGPRPAPHPQQPHPQQPQQTPQAHDRPSASGSLAGLETPQGSFQLAERGDSVSSAARLGLQASGLADEEEEAVAAPSGGGGTGSIGGGGGGGGGSTVLARSHDRGGEAAAAAAQGRPAAPPLLGGGGGRILEGLRLASIRTSAGPLQPNGSGLSGSALTPAGCSGRLGSTGTPGSRSRVPASPFASAAAVAERAAGGGR
jgi:hypothetical protein